jgi:hypothetical protein
MSLLFPSSSQVLCQMIDLIVCPTKIIVIAQEWPCWLVLAVALKLPLAAVFITKEMQSMFAAQAYVSLPTFTELWDTPQDWNGCTVLASGSHEYLSFVSTKLRLHAGPFVYATDILFKGCHQRDIERILGTWTSLQDWQGLSSNIVTHANFGGVFCYTFVELPGHHSVGI